MKTSSLERVHRGFRFLLLFAVSIILSCGCAYANEEGGHAAPEVYMTSTKTLNMRKGPSTKYAVVGKITPGEVVRVDADGRASSWIRVKKEDGVQGYAYSKYLTEVTAPVTEEASSSDVVKHSFSVEYVLDIVCAKVRSAYQGVLSAISHRSSKYVLTIMRDSGKAIKVLLPLFLVQVLLYLWMRRMYRYKDECDDTPSPLVGYIVVGVFAFLTVCQILGIAEVRKVGGLTDLMYVAMLLSTGMITVIVPWRIRMSALDDISDEEPGRRGVWADRVGAWMWILLLYPICKYYLDACENIIHKFPCETWLGMLLTLGIFGLCSAVLYCCVWPYVVVRYCLTSMGSGVLWWLNLVLFYGMGKYAYYMCSASFSGFIFIASLVCGFFVVCMVGIRMFNNISEGRCTNCHALASEEVGSTDDGYSYSTSTEWKTDDNGYASSHRRHSNASISSAERRVRTTYRTDHWRNHYECTKCGHCWDISHSHKYAVGHQTLGRRWTEEWNE